MSSHPPGIPGLPMIPGLPGPSGVFGHALAQADRRRPEAEHKPLPLNIPGFLHPSASAAHLALPSPMLAQSNLPSHILPSGVSGTNSSTTNTASLTPAGNGGGLNNNDNNTNNNSSAGVLDLHHRAVANALGASSVPGAHGHGGIGTVAGAVIAAVAAATPTGSGETAAPGGAAVGEIRVDASRCPVCFRQFDDRWKLERHARVHTGERPFACSRCTKTFTRKEHLTRHELSHDGEKPFSCSVCGKAFSRKDHVDRHQKTHMTR